MAQSAELTEQDLRIEQAADQAERILAGEDVRPHLGAAVAQALRQVTMAAPLRSLAIAFLLGVLAARRR